ncbi:MAG: T9SS type A sorting domain-containing protein [Candidatus Eisenbacteria bacterium]|nr:T9SS type A sorting domain-containing protein [Candidatus Eisenbacteria bacterium]
MMNDGRRHPLRERHPGRDVTSRGRTDRMRFKRVATAAASLFMLLSLWASSAGDPVPSTRPITGPTAHIVTSDSDLVGGSGAEGAVGDVRLENGRVVFIIGSLDHGPAAAASGGHLLDAAPASSEIDVLGYVLPTLGEWPRQAVYDSLRLTGDASEAAVILGGHDSEHTGCSVVTRYRLAADEPHLRLETVVRNTTAASVELVAGDSINWLHSEHFVPGYGFDVTGLTTLYDEWVGAAGVSSYGYCREAGLMSSTHGLDWTDTRVLDTTLAPGDSVTFQRYLVVGDGLSDASDGVHVVRDTPVGVVSGQVLSRNTGLPLEAVTLDFEVNGLAIYTRAVTGSDGLVDATLPSASYLVGVGADGYYSEELPLSIATGETTAVALELRPVGWNADKGDTLTVVMRPILSVPGITTAGGSFTIEALAPPSTSNWTAALRLGSVETPVTLTQTSYDDTRELWTLDAAVPLSAHGGLHDLVVTASGDVADTVANAVSVREAIDDDFYIVHITDTHLPTHNYSHDGEEALEDSSEMEDLRAVINDINTINPAFVLLTGDLVNEGELEDYLGMRVYTRAKRLLSALEVPVYVVAGNHDLGGWNSTPPSDGTARRDWWRFFGWRYLADPPAGWPVRTQDYSFDYGGVHFVGLETYDNYDLWRQEIYGYDSLTDDQYAWLLSDLEHAGALTPTVLFYHYDFSNQIDLSELGVECALWGHIHWSSGSITEPPYSISTGTVCDGRRLYRLVRFSDGDVLPSHTISAGAQGLLLRTAYDAPNDGTASSVTAVVTNETSERFEHGVVRFKLRADDAPYATDEGTIIRTVVDGTTAHCLVSLDIPAHGSAAVTVFPDTTGAEEPSSTVLHQSRPNPARSGTTLGFVLASRSRVALEVYDVTGRLVAVPFEGEAGPGPHDVSWNLTDRNGRPVASGVYFERLSGEGFSTTRKLVVIR